MIGDNPDGYIAFPVGGKLSLAEMTDVFDERLEKIRIEAARFLLKAGHQSFESHPRIYRGGRQRMYLPFVILIILHEDQVPQLDKPIAPLLNQERGGSFLDLRA